MTEIDPNKLSFFEIRDLCHLVGAPKEHSRYTYLLPEGGLHHDLRAIETDADVVNMTTLHRAWLAEKIIIYTDIDVEPLLVEYPDGGGVADSVSGDAGGDVGGIGGDAVKVEIDLESDYDEDDEDDENDEEDVEDVEDGTRDEEKDVEVSARVKEQNVEGDDDDWLNEGLEGDDFGNDIFAAQNLAPQGSSPNTALESSNAPHITPESSNAPHADPEWAEPVLEDDLVSMDGSDDEQVPEHVEFNAKSDMRNVVLKKEMKFPNAKVFKAALKEYAIKKPIDIKFKLNERTKISVHCKEWVWVEMLCISNK